MASGAAAGAGGGGGVLVSVWTCFSGTDSLDFCKKFAAAVPVSTGSFFAAGSVVPGFVLDVTGLFSPF